jgi:membrane protein DedA with SNARE-associated domain
MHDWITDLISSMGYIGIVFLMFLENVFPPIPSELIMPLAGYVAGRGELNFAGVVLAGTLGSVLGALPLYYLGHIVGEERLKSWAAKHGAWLAVSPEDIEKSKQWFDRHGAKAVLICRLVPGVRSLISIPAGLGKMNLPQFLFYTTIGTAMWSALLAGAGVWLGKNYEKVDKFLGPFTYVVLGALLLMFVLRVVKQKRAQTKDA